MKTYQFICIIASILILTACKKEDTHHSHGVFTLNGQTVTLDYSNGQLAGKDENMFTYSGEYAIDSLDDVDIGLIFLIENYTGSGIYDINDMYSISFTVYRKTVMDSSVIFWRDDHRDFISGQVEILEHTYKIIRGTYEFKTKNVTFGEGGLGDGNDPWGPEFYEIADGYFENSYGY